jgi:hypothetical protein
MSLDAFTPAQYLLDGPGEASSRALPRNQEALPR